MHDESAPSEALSPEVCLSKCLGFLDLSGLLAAAAPVVLEHEADLVALVERPHPCRFECGRMDKHVLAAALLLDEAEAFCSVEELHSACNAHAGVLSHSA